MAKNGVGVRSIASLEPKMNCHCESTRSFTSVQRQWEFVIARKRAAVGTKGGKLKTVGDHLRSTISRE